MVAASISHFLTAATKFSCCSSNKNVSFVFFSLALDICRSFSRWDLLAYRLLSLFLCLSLSLHSKFVDMTIKLSLILKKTRIQKLFPLSVFVFFSCLCLTRRGWLCDFPPKITLSCIWVVIPVNWVILHWYAFGADGRCYGHMITKISRMDTLPNCLRYGAARGAPLLQLLMRV